MLPFMASIGAMAALWFFAPIGASGWLRRLDWLRCPGTLSAVAAQAPNARLSAAPQEQILYTPDNAGGPSPHPERVMGPIHTQGRSSPTGSGRPPPIYRPVGNGEFAFLSPMFPVYAMLMEWARANNRRDIINDLDEWSRQLGNFFVEELSRGIRNSRYGKYRADGQLNEGAFDQQIWDKLMSYTNLLEADLVAALSEYDSTAKDAKIKVILDEFGISRAADHDAGTGFRSMPVTFPRSADEGWVFETLKEEGEESFLLRINRITKLSLKTRVGKNYTGARRARNTDWGIWWTQPAASSGPPRAFRS